MKKYPGLIVIGLALLLFVPGLGRVHLFDWDEINFAENAREMLLTKNYSQIQINFQPFWEKPPLFIWLQALAMRVFGVGEVGARLPNALCGALTLWVLFRLGSRERNTRFGLYWAALYGCTLLPHVYFKSGIIDPWFNLFIFLGIWSLLSGEGKEKSYKYSALGGLFIGLAILTKGPVALLVALLVVLVRWISTRFRGRINLVNALLFLGVGFLVSSLWFGPETLRNGPWFIKTFIEYQIRLLRTEDAGHGGTFFYHWIVLALGCLPAVWLMFGAWKGNSPFYAKPRNWMTILLFVVLILFSLVKTKIVHYSSLCWLPISYLAADALWRWIENGELEARVRKWQVAVITSLMLIYGLLTLVLPLAMHRVSAWSSRIQDPFARASLESGVGWQGWEGITGLLLMVGGVYGALLLRNGKFLQGVAVWCIATVAYVQGVMYFVVPQVERYSQGAAIDFFKSKSRENAYIETLNYKSYAHLFYGKKQAPTPTHPTVSRDSLLYLNQGYGVVYLSARADRLKPNDVPPTFNLIKSQGGFNFYQKNDPDSSDTVEIVNFAPMNCIRQSNK